MEERTLFFVGDTDTTEYLEKINDLIRETSATILLVKASQFTRLKDRFLQNTSEKTIELEPMPTLCFDYKYATNKLERLRIFDSQNEEKSRFKRLFFSSILQYSEKNTICSIGALIDHLEKLTYLQTGNQNSFQILRIKKHSSEQTITLSTNAYQSLEIFNKETHPSISANGIYKEGLSLMGILNLTCSKMGSYTLRKWLYKPLRNSQAITDRQEVVEFFVTTYENTFIKSIQTKLKNVQNLEKVYNKMRISSVSVSQWIKLVKTLKNAIAIDEILKKLPDQLYLRRKIQCVEIQKIREAVQLCENIIDLKASDASARFTVKMNVNSDLDEKKLLLRDLPNILTEAASQELIKLPNQIKECNCVYLPQIGYLLAIPLLYSSQNQDISICEHLEFVFVTNEVSHFKTKGMRELDEKLGDLQCEILDIEASIMHELQTHLLNVESVVESFLEVLAELDCLLAFSIVARERNYCRPKLVEQSIIRIRGGRHPLQEAINNNFVPNDLTVDVCENRLVVITGPNSSGKSIYLKQVGLIVFMAQIGSFVPAESVQLGVFDAIYTRMYNIDSISQMESTFISDLNQVSQALNDCTKHSLMLIDEFGKGTNHIDGISLLASLVTTLAEKSENCPISLFSTHLYDAFDTKIIPNSKLISYKHTNVEIENESIVYLYTLANGLMTESLGFNIASKVGLSKTFIDRAKKMNDLILRKLPLDKEFLTDEYDTEAIYQVIHDFMKMDIERTELSELRRRL